MSAETQNTNKRGSRKERRGVVVSAKSEKTVVVEIRRQVRHAQYHKFVQKRAKYAAHDLLGCKEGDIVRIQETRPISKTKRWRVVEKLSKDA